MKNIKFSVLVPVYNVEKYLKKCVESVINQTYKNFELILVNDGSTDNSGIICDEFAKLDNRIKVYHKANAGSLHSRIYAIERACGEFCVFLDSDDYLSTNALEIISAKIKEYDCDCVIFNFQRVKGEVIVSTPTWERIQYEECIDDKKRLYKKILFNQVYNSMCRKAVKTSIFAGEQYSGFYGICHGEDLLQSLEVIRNSDKTVFIPDVLYNYTINPNSITETISIDNYSGDFTVSKEVLKFVKSEKVFDNDTLDEFYSCCLRNVLHKIMQISRFSTTLANKRRIYQKIRNDSYYKEITSRKRKSSKLGKMKLVYVLFRIKCYTLLSLLGRFV